MSLASFIDHTILKPTTTMAEVEQVCDEALEHHFAAVCIPPYFVKTARSLTEPSDVKVATVIGFPFGYSHYKAKRREIKQAVKNGADELDMVINLAALKGGDFKYLQKEAEAITELTAAEGRVLKLIIESGMLSDEEIQRCCELYQQYKVDFLKTSTGYAEKGATVEAVRLMRSHLPPEIAVKASGGIRTAETARAMIDAGASRLGCSASVAIVTGSSGNGAY